VPPRRNLGSSVKHQRASQMKPGGSPRTSAYGSLFPDVYFQLEKEKQGQLSPGQFWTFETVQNHQSLNVARPGERSSACPAIPASKPVSAEAGTLSLVLDSSAEASEKPAASFSWKVGRGWEGTLSPGLEAPCAWLPSCLNGTSGPTSLHGKIVVVGQGCVFCKAKTVLAIPFTFAAGATYCSLG